MWLKRKLESQGVNPVHGALVGQLTGPNPTANSVSEREER